MPGVIQAPLESVGSDVVLVSLALFPDGLLNVLPIILFSRGLGTEVGIDIPDPGNGPRIQGCYHCRVFTYMMQDERGHPEMISRVDSFSGSCPDFPLEGHDPSICPSNPDAGVQAGLVVSPQDIPVTGFFCSHATAVWPWGPP